MANAEGEGKGSKPAANNSMVNAVALFDKGGSLIYMGQSKGTITVLDAASLKFLDFVKVCLRGVLHACILSVLGALHIIIKAECRGASHITATRLHCTTTNSPFLHSHCKHIKCLSHQRQQSCSYSSRYLTVRYPQHSILLSWM